MIADYHEGKLTLRGSMQCPFYVHTAVTPVMGMKPEDVAVIADEMWLENKHGKCKYKATFDDAYDPRVMQCEHDWWFPERTENAEEDTADEKNGLFGEIGRAHV